MKKERVRLSHHVEGNYIVKGIIVQFNHTDSGETELFYSEMLDFEEIEKFLRDVLGVEVLKEEKVNLKEIVSLEDNKTQETFFEAPITETQIETTNVETQLYNTDSTDQNNSENKTQESSKRKRKNK